MSCDNGYHVGDVGAVLVLTVQKVSPTTGLLEPVDLSGATTMAITLRKPDGSVQTFTASFATPSEGGLGDGTDGKIKITTTAESDFSVEGDYEAQAALAYPGFTGSSSIDVFPVGEKIA